MLHTEQSLHWQSKATGLYDLAYKNLGLVGIVIEPTPDLRRLQQRIIDAIAPFAAEKGTGEAFAPRPDGGAISQPTVDYVNNFVGPRTGMNYNPHLTVGIGTRDFVDAALDLCQTRRTAVETTAPTLLLAVDQFEELLTTAARAARAAFDRVLAAADPPGALVAEFRRAPGGANLVALGMEADLAACAARDSVGTVPRLDPATGWLVEMVPAGESG